ncbi:hypothetical protein ACFWXO_21845 [Kitasatospora sp. NPDC059088]|uniref:hypothetical protein n=1 Tax=Kitasatospora sp. NPDC059088 TaxID=3346722 RepID=UPI0036AB64F0
MELINTRRPNDAVTAYSALGWALSVGHRYRPRQGCTCNNPNCPMPGAHPRTGSPAVSNPEHVIEELEKAPGAGLLATTSMFDALVFPRTTGMAAIVNLEKIAQVPCIVTDESVTLLILPATGRYARTVGADVRIRSGPDDWIALPPSHGTRWDTPPWVLQTNSPVALLHGGDIGRHLEEPPDPFGGQR